MKKFCKKNGMEVIIRAHQLVMEGYRYMFDDSVLTVWSAPNYVNKYASPTPPFALLRL